MIGKTTEKGVVVFLLGLLAFIVVVGGSVLAYYGKQLPGEIIAIGAGAGGALSTFISRTNGHPVRRQEDEGDADYRKIRSRPEQP